MNFQGTFTLDSTGTNIPFLDTPLSLKYNLDNPIWGFIGACGAAGARLNRTEEVAGSNPARSTGSMKMGP
jgi:hypothetical protein